jgi:hypothetical protein
MAAGGPSRPVGAARRRREGGGASGVAARGQGSLRRDTDVPGALLGDHGLDVRPRPVGRADNRRPDGPISVSIRFMRGGRGDVLTPDHAPRPPSPRFLPRQRDA